MLSDNEMLELIPVKLCQSEVNNGIVTILFKREVKSFIDRLFFKKISAKPSKVDLDDIGSFIWNTIDGKKTVGELLSEAKNQFNDRIEPAQERVILFVNQMAGTKLIELYKKR